jgi:hypothetical protein
MKKIFKFLPITTILMMTYLFLASSRWPKTAIPVDGLLFGRPLQTTVDSDLAKLMLTRPQDSAVVSLFHTYKDQPLNTHTLAAVTKKYSADVATFYFLQRTYQNEQNQQAQDLYYTSLEQQANANAGNDVKALQEYFLAFVPGLAYKQDTTTGADFARQRRLLTANGIDNELIAVGEWDLADANAALVAQRLKTLSSKHKKIIVVSASKGGLETAIALGSILKPEETACIKAWVNVGGILRGSPVADNYLTAPKCWIAKWVLWTKGKRINVVQDMSYKKRSESFNRLQFPENIKIISFVGAPLATKIGREIKRRYCSMLKLGPNDGLTPLADEITPNGIVISEPGLDHYFRDPHIDKKTLALAMVAVKIKN